MALLGILLFVFCGLVAISLLIHVLQLAVHRSEKPLISARQGLYNLSPFISIKPAYRKVLEEKSWYYLALDSDQRKVFERRVQEFISMKRYISRSKSLEITDEMKALIAASAIQITFGLPPIYFRHFHRILIYPDNYYSTITRKYHKGEVNRAGIIVLSWSNFLDGINEHNDGKNLGLHEMAHALMLENMIANSEFDFLNRKHLVQWQELARQEITRIREGRQSPFRQYGGSNHHEFFAVAVELYFEQPEVLVQYNFQMYATLSAMLNQNVIELKKAG